MDFARRTKRYRKFFSVGQMEVVNRFGTWRQNDADDDKATTKILVPTRFGVHRTFI